MAGYFEHGDGHAGSIKRESVPWMGKAKKSYKILMGKSSWKVATRKTEKEVGDKLRSTLRKYIRPSGDVRWMQLAQDRVH
jgi:hypothetical protein